MAAADWSEGGLSFLGLLTSVLSLVGLPAKVPFQIVALSDNKGSDGGFPSEVEKAPRPPRGGLLLLTLLVCGLPSIFHSGARPALGVRRGLFAPSVETAREHDVSLWPQPQASLLLAGDQSRHSIFNLHRAPPHREHVFRHFIVCQGDKQNPPPESREGCLRGSSEPG